jgi:hypothetical protein
VVGRVKGFAGLMAQVSFAISKIRALSQISRDSKPAEGISNLDRPPLCLTFRAFSPFRKFVPFRKFRAIQSLRKVYPIWIDLRYALLSAPFRHFENKAIENGAN